MVGISQRVTADPRRWVEVGVPVGADADAPLTAVDQAMVVTAEQHSVLQRGVSPVGPVLDVMALAPARRPVAARERAAAVAKHQGSA